MGWLYVLPFLLPIAAFCYLWVTARLSAAEDPWDKKAFFKWASENFVLLFVVGFAAVWASLQLAFTDTSWGSSLVGAAAIVGGGLVASVTAMTAIAGKVRERERADRSADGNGSAKPEAS